MAFEPLNIQGSYTAPTPSFQPLNFNQTSQALGVANQIPIKSDQQIQNDVNATETKSFFSSLGSNLADIFIKPAAKFAKSAINAPIDIARSAMGKDPLTSKDEGFAGPTFQSQYKDLFSGNKLEIAQKVSDAIGNIFGGAADTLGIGEALQSKPVKAALDNLSKQITEHGNAKASQEALDIVNPKLTAKETEQALAEGRGKGGGFFSKTKITPDKRTIEVAESVKGLVRKGASGAENISSVKNALSEEASKLKTQIEAVDHPYSFKELNSKLNSVEKPLTVKSDATLSRQFDLTKDAMMKIAEKNGGKISSLLDTRKEFDALIEKEFPNLYEKENAPMRNAVTSMRNAVNDFIEENLPKNVSFKNSLRKQSLYYDAIDNIAGKSVGETTSTGAERLGKAIKKHPVGAAITGATAVEAGRKIITGQY